MRHDADRIHDQPRTNGDRTLRLTVPEAAGVMDISAEAVRQRIKRGTLPTEKDSSGHVFVLLKDQADDRSRKDGDSTRQDGDRTSDRTALVESMEGQIEYLKETVARRDEESAELRRIIAGLVQRVPELEAAPNGSGEPREAPVTASEEPHSTAPPNKERPSWWRRFFGLE
jgi:hypothetical protein